MTVRVVERLTSGPHEAIVPEVRGTACFTGKNEFWFDPEDALHNGFILR